MRPSLTNEQKWLLKPWECVLCLVSLCQESRTRWMGTVSSICFLKIRKHEGVLQETCSKHIPCVGKMFVVKLACWVVCDCKITQLFLFLCVYPKEPDRHTSNVIVFFFFLVKPDIEKTMEEWGDGSMGKACLQGQWPEFESPEYLWSTVATSVLLHCLLFPHRCDKVLQQNQLQRDRVYSVLQLKGKLHCG